VRRYRQPSDLAAAWRQTIVRWADAPLPTRLPPDGAPLADWVRFEGTALGMHALAHRCFAKAHRFADFGIGFAAILLELLNDQF
jgi:hypothetical protein